MKTKISPKNYRQLGFAHPVLLVVLLIGVAVVIGISGQRVLKQQNQEEASDTTSQVQPIIVSDETATQQLPGEVVSIDSAGSAAAPTNDNTANPIPSSTPAPSKIEIGNSFGVTSPIGSLGQMLLEVKKGNYSNALYFVTPRLLASGYSAISASDIQNFDIRCQENSVCNTLLTAKYEINPAHAYENSCTLPQGSVYVECRLVSMKFLIRDGVVSSAYYKSVGPDRYTVSLKMVRTQDATNWMIDGVTVDSFTL